MAATANPYLLVNRSTVGGVKPISRSYIQETVRRVGITARNCTPTGSSTKHVPAAATPQAHPPVRDQ